MPQQSAKIRRLKFWWHLSYAYLKRYQLRILLALIFFLLTSYSVYKAIPNIFRSNMITIGYVGTYNLQSLPSDVLSLATLPLISKDNKGRAVPALASHWTVSEDGKTYVIFLKDNLEWHDGSVVEAKDISLAIKNVQITALNNKTIQFKLPNPIASFPLALDTPVFKANTFYGTGEFRIVDLKQIDDVIKKITLHPKDNNLPRVEIKFYPNEEQAIYALKIGEIKVLAVSNVKELEKWPNLNVKKEIAQDELVSVFYNTSDNLFSSKDLRQALSYSITKDSFDGQTATGPISSNSWAYNPNVKKYEFNQAKAKELLAKAEIKDKNISLSYTVGLKTIAEKIKDDWAYLGLNVNLKEEKGIPKQFQALLAIDKLPSDPDQYTFWHSTQKATNITQYTNVKIDKLLEDARVTQNEDERKALYQDFQRFLTEDAPATFLYNPYKYMVSYKNVDNLLSKLPK